MTLLEMRNDVKARIGPDHEITNAQIDTFLNEGYHHVISKIMDDFQDYYGDTETIATVASTQEYTPTKEFVYYRFLDYDAGVGTNPSYPYVRLTNINLSELGSTQNNDTTRFSTTNPYYYLWGSKIGILPIPSATGSIIIHGIVKPVDLSSDDDVPNFISTHHNLLVTWAIKCLVEAVDENYLDGQRKMAEFEAGCDEMLRLIGARMSSQSKRITVTSLY